MSGAVLDQEAEETMWRKSYLSKELTVYMIHLSKSLGKETC